MWPKISHNRMAVKVTIGTIISRHNAKIRRTSTRNGFHNFFRRGTLGDIAVTCVIVFVATLVSVGDRMQAVFKSGFELSLKGCVPNDLSSRNRIR
jgi:hypothetical protein